MPRTRINAPAVAARSRLRTIAKAPVRPHFLGGLSDEAADQILTQAVHKLKTEPRRTPDASNPTLNGPRKSLNERQQRSVVASTIGFRCVRPSLRSVDFTAAASSQGAAAGSKDNVTGNPPIRLGAWKPRRAGVPNSKALLHPSITGPQTSSRWVCPVIQDKELGGPSIRLGARDPAGGFMRLKGLLKAGRQADKEAGKTKFKVRRFWAKHWTRTHYAPEPDAIALSKWTESWTGPLKPVDAAPHRSGPPAFGNSYNIKRLSGLNTLTSSKSTKIGVRHNHNQAAKPFQPVPVHVPVTYQFGEPLTSWDQIAALLDMKPESRSPGEKPRIEQQDDLEAKGSVSPEGLRHLLRLSALPSPKSDEEEAKMLRTLEAQLEFVRAVQSVDTTGVKPLVAIRDETEEAMKESEITVESLRSVFEMEEQVGPYKRIVPSEKAKQVTAELRRKEKGLGWDPVERAPSKVGRFIKVNTKES